MIPQFEPLFGLEEREALNRYMASGGWLMEYKKTAELEAMIADYVGSQHCIMMPNGTLTLYAILCALGVGAGDEVIVPAFTMIATANAVKMTGATPVFVDIDSCSLCLDLGRVKDAVTERTKALMYVSLNGRSASAFSLKYHAPGLSVVEDAAQSLGSRRDGKHLGTTGIAGSFSFSVPKIITMGQGGCIVTNDDNLKNKLRRFKNFGRAAGGQQQDEYVDFGVNLKITDMQAVVGIEQMKKLPARVARKKEIYALYRQELYDIMEFVETDLADVTPWYVDILVDNRNELVKHLFQNGIGTRSFYPCLTSTPVYPGQGRFPVAESVTERGLWLPSSLTLADDDILRICSVIRSCKEQ